jgi:hypothetical protein
MEQTQNVVQTEKKNIRGWKALVAIAMVAIATGSYAHLKASIVPACGICSDAQTQACALQFKSCYLLGLGCTVTCM